MTTSSGKPKPRVVLADDQPATSALLERLLRTEFDVVATVGDGRTLVEAVACTRRSIA